MNDYLTQEKENCRIDLMKNCLDCVIQELCYYHKSIYASEFFLCTQCLKENNKEVKGKHRYDSLVLCEEHNKPMGEIMTKLNQIFSGPNVTRITDLGL